MAVSWHQRLTWLRAALQAGAGAKLMRVYGDTYAKHTASAIYLCEAQARSLKLSRTHSNYSAVYLHTCSQLGQRAVAGIRELRRG